MNNQAKNQLLDKIPLLKKEISYLFNHQYINEIKYEELSNRLNKLKTNKVLQENTVFYQTIHYEIKSLIYLIAFYFYRNNDLVKAIKLWKMIDENYIYFYQCKDYRNHREKNFSECNQKLYAQTQFNLGLIQRQRGNFNQAIKHYLNSKTQESYYNLANIYYIQNKKTEALKCLRKIKNESGYIFSLSQMKLGDIYNEMQQYNMAKSAYKEVVNITNIAHDNEELYLYAHINLAILYCKNKQYNDSKKHIQQAKTIQDDYFISLLSKIDNENNQIMEYLLNILLCVIKIKNNLLIDENTSIYEQSMAHYTNVSVAIELLGKNSPLRMTNAHTTNDPQEGKTLYSYLNQCNLNVSFEQLDFIPFISCFTLNHDSLNQFRLYGKENEKEATGLSIVLDNKFFGFDQKLTIQQSGDNEIKNNDNGKLPLYRCIYIAPQGKIKNNPYIKVAHRDEVTFHHEKNRTITDWKGYQKNIAIIEKEVTKYIKEIVKNIHLLYQQKYINQTIQTLNFILLPLHYLIKNAAYEEEQECRILKLLEPKSTEIDLDLDRKYLYRNYLKTTHYVQKIYLSTGAAKYEDIFRALSIKKISLSRHPFRNKN